MSPSQASELAKESRLLQPVTARWFAAVFGAALGYAILRYHILGSVEWSHFPLYILNKAVSLAAVLFVACSCLVGPVFRQHNDDPRIRLIVVKFCGLMGLTLGAMQRADVTRLVVCSLPSACSHSPSPPLPSFCVSFAVEAPAVQPRKRGQVRFSL